MGRGVARGGGGARGRGLRRKHGERQSRCGGRAHAQAAQLGFVKPHLGHLMAVLEIDQGRVGTLAAVGYEAEIETWRA